MKTKLSTKGITITFQETKSSIKMVKISWRAALKIVNSIAFIIASVKFNVLSNSFLLVRPQGFLNIAI